LLTVHSRAYVQMLEAVQVIHDEKIVHSDLKPANFVLVRGQLKLIDFGIANAIASDTTNIQRDQHVGTVNYMSPEAIDVPDGMRRIKLGRASDVWSLGCILYQMVYGATPFSHITNPLLRMKAIPDPNHAVEFPAHTTRGADDAGRRKVRSDVVLCIKACLVRHPKDRATIPELLEQEWLSSADGERTPRFVCVCADVCAQWSHTRRFASCSRRTRRSSTRTLCASCSSTASRSAPRTPRV
jgi:serine/threonine-protein kinase TTK/MPS1